MSVYTGKGDKGFSSTSNGDNLPKAALVFEALGLMDEFQAALAFVFLDAAVKLSGKDRGLLRSCNTALFSINGYIAGCSDLDSAYLLTLVTQMEEQMDALEESLPEITGFVEPGESAFACWLNLSRVKCRTAERSLVKLFKTAESFDESAKSVLKFMNRFSDYLFMLMRAASCDTPD
ncbi:hypothetical protein GF360_02820 [candidate division WWE3 bacterium]|nr:hypothetical protein [candidate division WWE3 bacterium]